MSGRRCCKLVIGEGSYLSHRCTRQGVVERDGKPFCKQHDPEAVAARRKARDEKFDAKWRGIERASNISKLRVKIADIAIRLIKQQASFEELEAAVSELERIEGE